MSIFHCRSPGNRFWILLLALVCLCSSCCPPSSPSDLERERVLREKAERNYLETQHELLSSRLFNGLLIGFLFLIGFLSLMTGAALGSSARHDSRRYRKEVFPYDSGRKSPTPSKKTSKKEGTPPSP